MFVERSKNDGTRCTILLRQALSRLKWHNQTRGSYFGTFGIVPNIKRGGYQPCARTKNATRTKDYFFGVVVAEA